MHIAMGFAYAFEILNHNALSIQKAAPRDD